MEELHGEKSHGLPLVQDVKAPRIDEPAENGGFDIHETGEFEQRINFIRRNSQGHSLLGFREQNLPGVQAWVFQRGLF